MLAALAALFFAQAPVQAPAKDRVQAESKPVEMTSSGGLSIDLKRQIGIARGDVLIRRDDVLVCCDEAEAKYSENKIERVTCKGRVVIVRPDGTRRDRRRRGVHGERRRGDAAGDAHVVTDTADLTGERIIYDIAKDKLEVEGGKSRFKFNPRQQYRPKPSRAACGPSPKPAGH